ncbi:primosomal protein N' [bacterium]
MIIQIALPLPIKTFFDYLVPDEMQRDIEIGKRVYVTVGNKKKVGFIIGKKESTDRKLKEIIKVLDESRIVTPELFELAKWMSDYYACSLGESLSAICPKKWSVRKKTVTSFAFQHVKSEPFHMLNNHQKSAVSKINVAIENNNFRSFLLFGVPGSGKTEVYHNAIKKILAQGKEVLYLVPEISLTPQTINWLIKRFEGKAALWHSMLTDRERFIIWQKIRAKEIKILVGPRSAIFAPFENLGLVIIDEEHEDTYKQESKPSYDARFVGYFRAKYNDAVLLLGSATPSIKTWHDYLAGEYELLKLPEKVFKQKIDSSVRVIDMKRELESNNYSIFSRILNKAIQDRLYKREQIVLFLNRRGFSTHVFCRKCGYVVKCPNCDVSMVYHETSEQHLVCHYCGHKAANIKVCPNCKSEHIRFFGTGIQKAEKLIKKSFPTAKLLRLDSDIARDRAKFDQIYESFKRNEYDILLATQIGMKGLDFPNVSLVGIITADTALNLPDFRASERTFSLLMQASGRGGRRYRPAEIILQTYYPNHYAITQLANQKSNLLQNYKDFYANEILWRKKLVYPPFVSLVSITLRGPSDDKVKIESYRVHSYLTDKFARTTKTILGPFQPIITKLHGKYRWNILVKESHTQQPTQDVNHDWLFMLDSIKLPKNVQMTVEIDPVSMI